MQLLSSALTTGSSSYFSAQGTCTVTVVGTFDSCTVALQRLINGTTKVDVDQSTDGATVDQAVQFTVTGLSMQLELWGTYCFTIQSAGGSTSITSIEIDGTGIKLA